MSGWILRPRPDPTARLRLFCFPYAGGGAAPFRVWADDLPADVELCLVQLPGREGRLNEPPYARITPLVAALVTALRGELGKPYAFFGHSLGALLGFELLRALRRVGAPSPRGLFVSGYRAPHLPDPEPPLHRLPGAALWEELRRLNGTPPEVLENAELRRLVEPTLRADFAIDETYLHTNEAPLTCPISAFGGISDREVSGEMLAAWRRHTEGSFELRMMPGDHFFIHASRPILLDALAGDLERLLSRAGGGPPSAGARRHE
ncbi:MAG TPA: alpha/beta fold hydrolase [Candidatus Polarisedimenticolia bacterium]